MRFYDAFVLRPEGFLPHIVYVEDRVVELKPDYLEKFDSFEDMLESTIDNQDLKASMSEGHAYGIAIYTTWSGTHLDLTLKYGGYGSNALKEMGQWYDAEDTSLPMHFRDSEFSGKEYVRHQAEVEDIIFGLELAHRKGFSNSLEEYLTRNRPLLLPEMMINEKFPGR